MRLFSFVVILFTLYTSNIFADDKADLKQVVIATGSVNGLYYTIGREICNSLNETVDFNKEYRCVTTIGAGSERNVDAVLSGSVLLGIGQYDHFVEFSKTNTSSNQLVMIGDLYDEIITIIANSTSNIHKISDLRGKKIAVNTFDAINKKNLEIVLGLYNLDIQDLAEVKIVSMISQPDMLCNGSIDAVFDIVGHPNIITKELINSCDVDMLSIDKDLITKAVANSNLSRAYIPFSSYSLNKKDIQTLGVKAVLFGNNQLDETLFNILKRSLAINIKDIRKKSGLIN
jgi:uncharacterized protein